MSSQPQSQVWGGLLPKSETQALQFVLENPEFDGRKVIVGILDTGVDPAAVGLSVCPDGSPKVIDVVDCTGSGDVHMSALVELDEDDETLNMSSSKSLKVNKKWVNPTKKFRWGVKRAFDFYPNPATKHLTKDRSEKFTVEQKKHESYVLIED